MTATSDVAMLLALDPDCIVYSPLHLDPDELAGLLRAGVDVVTTAEMMTGSTLGADVRDGLRQAALDGGATLFGSGMNPGFAQLLAGVAAGISSGVQQGDGLGVRRRRRVRRRRELRSDGLGAAAR